MPTYKTSQIPDLKYRISTLILKWGHIYSMFQLKLIFSYFDEKLLKLKIFLNSKPKPHGQLSKLREKDL